MCLGVYQLKWNSLRKWKKYFPKLRLFSMLQVGWGEDGGWPYSGNHFNVEKEDDIQYSFFIAQILKLDFLKIKTWVQQSPYCLFLPHLVTSSVLIFQIIIFYYLFCSKIHNNYCIFSIHFKDRKLFNIFQKFKMI